MDVSETYEICELCGVKSIGVRNVGNYGIQYSLCPHCRIVFGGIARGIHEKHYVKIQDELNAKMVELTQKKE